MKELSFDDLLKWCIEKTKELGPLAKWEDFVRDMLKEFKIYSKNVAKQALAEME